MNPRVLTLALAISITLASYPAAAQPAPMLQYAVKFVCGRSDGRILAPGTYFTAINVHNPAKNAIDLRKTFAVALPDEKAGPVSKPHSIRLGPGQALEIDCQDILRWIGEKLPFYKGFAVVEADTELNVVAVYTAAGSTKQIETMEVKRVAGQRLAAACPDLTVESIERPQWDGANHRSVIRVAIKNIGGAPAGASTARVVDPSTPQPGGAPYASVAATPSLNPGQVVTVTFYLPYWVFNPDADLEVTADYKNELSECNEDNNIRTYHEKG